MHLTLAPEESRRGRQEPPQSCLPPSSWSASVVLCWAPSRGGRVQSDEYPRPGRRPSYIPAVRESWEAAAAMSGKPGELVGGARSSVGLGKGHRVGEPCAKCQGHWCGGSPRKSGSRRPCFRPGRVGSVAFLEAPVGSENVAVKLGADFSIHFSQSSPAC